MSNTFNSIEEALEDIRQGKIVIVCDDENRENEGDFICAAEKVTPKIINFMAKYGRGLICAPITKKRCEELSLDLVTSQGVALYDTPFTVSIDLIGDGCTTGISASDRAKTVLGLTRQNGKKSIDFARPGHIFPLMAKDGGVLRRPGHTEAAVDLARMAGLDPSGVIVEIMNDDGSMARVPDLFELADKFGLKFITIKDIIQYRLRKETLVEKMVTVNLPTKYGMFQISHYKQTTNEEEHLALIKGTWKKDEPILVRVHSSCVTGDIFASLRCDCGDQLTQSMQMIEKEGKGVILYMNQEGRGIGLLNKLKAYKIQQQGKDTVDANIELGFKADQRDYGIGAQILRDLGVSKMRLITNNPQKRVGLDAYNLEIVENIPIKIASNPYNEKYLKTKKYRLGHHLDI